MRDGVISAAVDNPAVAVIKPEKLPSTEFIVAHLLDAVPHWCVFVKFGVILPAIVKDVKLPKLERPGALVILAPNVEPLKTVFAPMLYDVAVTPAHVGELLVLTFWFRLPTLAQLALVIVTAPIFSN